MPDRKFGFDTLCLHAGQIPDVSTGARALPIYQTTSFVFDSVDHAASLFNLQTFGNVYSRISNPTVCALEERVAALEGGRAALAAATGMAAQTAALLTLAKNGDHISGWSRHNHGWRDGRIGQIRLGQRQVSADDDTVARLPRRHLPRDLRRFRIHDEGAHGGHAHAGTDAVAVQRVPAAARHRDVAPANAPTLRIGAGDRPAPRAGPAGRVGQ